MSRTAKTALFISLLSMGVSTQAFAGETRQMDLKDFDRVTIDGLIDLNITQGKTFKVEMSGEAEALDGARVKVVNGHLTMDHEERDIKISTFSDLDDYVITLNITMPDLVELNVDGMSDVVMKDMKLKSIKVLVDGKGDLEMTGSCESVDFNLDGLSKVMAKKFECKNVDISLDGIGSARVYASEAVDASVDGLAKITVYGKAKTRKVREDGFGGVSFVD